MGRSFTVHSDLSTRGTLYGGQVNPYRIQSHVGGKSIQRVSANTKSKAGSGPMPSFIGCDEYHEMADKTMLTLYEDGTKHRIQPITLITTNAGTGIQTPCWEEHRYAQDVSLGKTCLLYTSPSPRD